MTAAKPISSSQSLRASVAEHVLRPPSRLCGRAGRAAADQQDDDGDQVDDDVVDAGDDAP